MALLLWGCRKCDVSARCRRVVLGGRRRRWGWSVGSVVGRGPYHHCPEYAHAQSLRVRVRVRVRVMVRVS